MKLVLLETPYAGDVLRNLAYARACMRACFGFGWAPFASHLLYTQPGVLDDEIGVEREQGMEGGFAWGERAELTVLGVDLGISRGMQAGIDRAQLVGRAIERLYLPEWSRARALHEGGQPEELARLVAMHSDWAQYRYFRWAQDWREKREPVRPTKDD